MTASLPSAVQRARLDLAARMRDLRLDAGLSGLALSVAAGWHPSKTSRIENGRQTPADADIRAWCAVCGAGGQAADLIAAARTADSMYLEFRRLHVTGLRWAQEMKVPLYERTHLMRVYCSNVIPGLVQAPAYASALMTAITAFQRTPDDVGEAVAARMNRNRILYRRGHRFQVVIEEAVLHYRVGSTAVMSEQLRHLLSVLPLPSLTLGIIPFAAEPRPMWTLEPFTIFDTERVLVELLGGQITVSAPRDIALYENAFGNLLDRAVQGADARGLIMSALAAL